MSRNERGSVYGSDWLNVNRVLPETQITFTPEQKIYIDELRAHKKTFEGYFINAVVDNTDVSRGIRDSVRDFVNRGMTTKSAMVRMNEKEVISIEDIQSSAMLTELNLPSEIFSPLNKLNISVPDAYILMANDLMTIGLNRKNIFKLQERLYAYLSELAQWTAKNVNYTSAYMRNLPDFRRRRGY